MSAAAPADLVDERLLREHGAGAAARRFMARLRSGELGPIPVLVGLLVITIVFQTLNAVFLTPFNLVNLTLQIAATGTIAVGVVLVLLLGEIDLSVGSVSGLCASILVVLNTHHGMPAGAAVAAALLVGAGIGLLHGLVFTKLGVPSFVVTLAGLLAWQGLQLRVLGKDGTISLPSGGALRTLGARSFIERPFAYVVVALIAVAYFAALYVHASRRRAANLSAMSPVAMLVRAGGLGVVLAVAVWHLNKDRGVATLLVIFVTLVVVLDLVLRRTRYGRMVYAVGGNIEAARRAGIPVDRVRVVVFVAASTLAALGGVLAAARLGSVSQASGQSDVLVNAIAAAVIGGTSLFGGRGTTYSALLGMLVIGAIANGLTLINLSSGTRFMITGGALLLAVVVDALSRRGRLSHGRG